jgi:hypothetical protein
MGNAYKGDGTSLTIGGVTVGEITNIKLPKRTSDVVETTVLSDTWATFMRAGGLSAGEITIQGNYYPGDTGQAALETGLSATTASSFVITLSDSGAEAWSFSGFVKDIDPGEAEKKSTLKFSVTIQITGTVTRTA